MEYKQSETLLNISNISFAAVRFGETDQFVAVIAIAQDGHKWMICAPQSKMTFGKLNREVTKLINKAITLAAKEFSPNYMGETTAYVKNLPEGHRSNYLASVDRELYTEAISDISNALQHALTHDDSFRAAVEFESRVPYLIGNRELVSTMEDILMDFKRKYNQENWIITACEVTEEALRRENSFTDSQIIAWKKAEGISDNSLQK